jgi:hypothetical protein
MRLILLALVPVLILILGAEGIARLCGHPPLSKEKSPGNSALDIYDPEIVRLLRDGDIKVEGRNSHGFRSREFGFDKAPDEFVIVVVGGSVATGAWATDYENTPARFIEAHLANVVKKRLGKRLTVYSVAEPSSDIEDEAFWLFKLGFSMHPDIVLSITGYNNLFHSRLSYWELSSGGRGFSRMAIGYRPNDIRDRGVRGVLGDLRLALTYKLQKTSRLAQWLTYHAEQRREAARGEAPDSWLTHHLDRIGGFAKPAEKPVRAAQRLRATAEHMGTLCAALGIKYLVVLQPIRGCGPAKMSTLPLTGADDDRDQLLYRTMMETWTNPPAIGFPFTDASYLLADRLEQMDQFGDPCHLWDEGFKVFNSEIVKFITDHL